MIAYRRNEMCVLEFVVLIFVLLSVVIGIAAIIMLFDELDGGGF